MKLWLAALPILAVLTSCTVEQCPNRSSEELKEGVARYVIGNSLPELSGVSRSDLNFMDDTRHYNADSGAWSLNFEANAKQYIALIDCGGNVELSAAPSKPRKQ